MKIELPDMNKMPNVDQLIVLQYIHSLNFFQTVISYAIHWTSTRKVVQLQKWITENITIPDDLKGKVNYIKKLIWPNLPEPSLLSPLQGYPC